MLFLLFCFCFFHAAVQNYSVTDQLNKCKKELIEMLKSLFVNKYCEEKFLSESSPEPGRKLTYISNKGA